MHRYLEPFFSLNWIAVRGYRASHGLWVRGWKNSAEVLSQLVLMVTGVQIEPGARIGVNFSIAHPNGIVIGHSTEIGTHCTLYHQVTLGSSGGRGRSMDGRIHPKIGNHVTIYAGAKVIGPVEIGDYADVAANAVVLDDVPPYAVVGGIPAKVLRVKSSAPANIEAARIANRPGPTSSGIG